MSELLPVTEDSGGAQPLDPNVDPSPQIKPEVPVKADVVTATPEKPLSRRDSIAKALEQKQAKNAEADAAPSVPVVEGRARDPATGRFINKDGSLAAADPGAAAAATVQSAQLPSRKPMPKAWKQDYAPKWEALDPDLANFVADQEARREQDVLVGVEKYRGLSQYAEGLRDVIAPREQALAQQYGSAAHGIKALFEISDAASQNPAGFIQWFARQRGIDLRSLVPAQPGQQPQDPNAPQGQALPDLTPFIQQAIQPFAQRTMAMEQQMQQYQQERQQAEASQREQAVNTFFSEADATGAIKYPLDDDAMDAFAQRVKFLRSNNPDWDYRRVLEKSYEELTWTSESLRSKRLEADAKRKEAETKERVARELAAKKAAAVSVKGAPGTSPAASIDPSNRRAVIERAVANLQR